MKFFVNKIRCYVLLNAASLEKIFAVRKLISCVCGSCDLDNAAIVNMIMDSFDIEYLKLSLTKQVLFPAEEDPE